MDLSAKPCVAVCLSTSICSTKSALCPLPMPTNSDMGSRYLPSTSKTLAAGRPRPLKCHRRRLNQLCKAPLRYPRAESFRQRLLGKEQKLLLTCFNHPDVPPTNNQAERSLRPVVIMRRVIQGTRCDKGLENHSVLRSLFETAKRQGKKAHCFFEALFITR